MPFAESNQFQIVKYLADGEHPVRLETPSMDDYEWNLILGCWVSITSARPKMEDVVKTMTSTIHADDDGQPDEHNN